ncbi:DNA-binding protein [bacterium (Candidatus Blackallbacteria) CG17_big_fil_post_rev_8_21_14_2_50_48_46]|uniref:DNA-binding protein n=1 Tax=bacterium (Candidatus Blackallbacteria) CG17_big_fil_post_rev_8_21_14_2_50_48_46 TaxID=2014261 RepID=A0A2M7G060_9BACT|nr:MAG: DNA-binding protein [bacterium (Candidatus Blackallbacteria) CG18_big_fil_WC_8_21_14_2_50_49_26]PIW15060.1 MAG: DNA-binding protein [bacterium (Candidatus Blackallbacteria) CG17_big_fil_post_rev_8_21_14_2_50_48_46]PIW47617.1 MAG: DNA-binding protein [bacterium (Candidatus Blackallbacteria) CG13_big_fil_rev_8_21_14_2_50_49_14]
MQFSELKAFCLSLPAAEETFPFGPEVCVFKVAGKMFALCRPDVMPLRVNLKSEPKLAELLRENYEAVAPGWHMNKRHWNTVSFDSDLPDIEIFKQIEHSYLLVLSKLPRSVRESIPPKP